MRESGFRSRFAFGMTPLPSHDVVTMPNDEAQSRSSQPASRSAARPPEPGDDPARAARVPGAASGAHPVAVADRRARQRDRCPARRTWSPAVSLPKQTVGDLIDDLEMMKMVERFPDPDHGVIKRVRLGPKGKVWAAEVRRVAAATEARWATRLGSKKMKSLRALLEELAVDRREPRRSRTAAPSANASACAASRRPSYSLLGTARSR